jgi:tetratricopeptide (TPR) repeat protein
MRARYFLPYVLLSSFGMAFQSNPAPYRTALKQPEATSLFGKWLHAISFPTDTKARLDSNLAVAKSDFDKDPGNADNIIWYGRRLAYLWRYRDAIDVFTKGIERHPSDPRMYRHRGHRYITIREFSKAVDDLAKAAQLIKGKQDEVELDGQPNRLNIPTGTLHSNIWYHLGLAYYLLGEFDKALEAYLECMKVSNNPDMLCAASDWLYMTYQRLGRKKEAQQVLRPITKDMNIIENTAYHKRLLMYKGELPADSLLNTQDATDLDIATQGYGLANWYFYTGQEKKALDLFQRVIGGAYWAAFGYIAAEADLKRISMAK